MELKFNLRFQLSGLTLTTSIYLRRDRHWTIMNSFQVSCTYLWGKNATERREEKVVWFVKVMGGQEEQDCLIL